MLNSKTFQEVTLEKMGNIGVVGFDFYNGAMSTVQCERMAAAIQEIASMKDLDVLVLKGSKRNWSNGIHLNVIEHSATPEE
jgi:putative two-component system hydrogenase maturation factor HypX/HoxX